MPRLGEDPNVATAYPNRHQTNLRGSCLRQLLTTALSSLLLVFVIQKVILSDYKVPAVLDSYLRSLCCCVSLVLSGGGDLDTHMHGVLFLRFLFKPRKLAALSRRCLYWREYQIVSIDHDASVDPLGRVEVVRSLQQSVFIASHNTLLNSKVVCPLYTAADSMITMH